MVIQYKQLVHYLIIQGVIPHYQIGLHDINYDTHIQAVVLALLLTDMLESVQVKVNNVTNGLDSLLICV